MNYKRSFRDVSLATSMTSVRLSVTLVDCDHTVKQKVEIGTRQARSVSWLPVRAAHGSYYISCDTEFYRGMENVEFCTSAAHVQRLARRAISASAELLVIRAEKCVTIAQAIYDLIISERRTCLRD